MSRTITKKNGPKKPKQQKKPKQPTPVVSKEEKAKREQFLKEIWGLVLVCFSVFVFISTRFPESTGVVGYWTIEIIGQSLVGEALTYLPFFMLLTAISFFYSKSKWKQTILSVSIGFIAFTVILELATNGPAQIFSPISSIEAGGLIGHSGLYIFHKLFGLYGTIVVLAGLFFVTPFLIFNVSVAQVCREFKDIYNKTTQGQQQNQQDQNNPRRSIGSVFGRLLKSLAYLLFFTTRKETILIKTEPRLTAKKGSKKRPTVSGELTDGLEFPEFELEPKTSVQTPDGASAPVTPTILGLTKEEQETALSNASALTSDESPEQTTANNIPIQLPDTVSEEKTDTNAENTSEKQSPTISFPKKIVQKLSKTFESKIPDLTALTKKDYKLPALSMIADVSKFTPNSKENLARFQQQSEILEQTLQSFNVDATVVNITPGPSVTRYELKPGKGVKIAKITSLSNDIALKLASNDIRIEAPIPGKSLIGIEVPNSSVDMITLRTIIEKTNFYDKDQKLLCGVGLTITGDAICMNIEKLPHVLIAGATGAGKSVCINSIILSILMRSTPDDVKFLMIDPKKVELSLFEGIPHLLSPVVTNADMAAATLKKWALAEMETRYDNFSKAGVKNLEGYNELIESIHKLMETDPEKAQEKIKKCKLDPADQIPQQLDIDSKQLLDQASENDGTDTSSESGTASEPDTLASETPEEPEPKDIFIPKKLPRIVVIIDELADLMMVASAEVETTICRLAQMARATGIHLVIATQRPSVNVVTGLIKANVPSRISFFLQSQIDSRTILDMAGAEKLLGKGDMLYSPVGSFKPQRVQGVFVSEKEVKTVVEFWKQQETPNYVQELLEVTPLTPEKKEKAPDDRDELYTDAKDIVINTKYASTSYLQRKLKIGYNRAARIMEQLEEDGIISQYAGEKKPRNIVPK